MNPSEVARGLEVAANFSLRWRELVAAAPGNPLEVEIAEVAGAGAVAVGAGGDKDSPWFNIALGVCEAGPSAVGPLKSWARERGVHLNIEIPDSCGSDDLMGALDSGGAEEIEPIDLLLGPVVPSDPPDADIRAVAPGEDLARVFAATLALGHGAPEQRPEAMDAAAAAFAAQPGWSCLVAMFGGEPSGAAVLTVEAEIGYLANASVLPKARQHGLQSALIAERTVIAAASGCSTLASLARAGGASHRNLQRAGLEVACTIRTFSLG